MLLRLDSALATPLYRQICEQLAAWIEDGTLRPGDRLPATRDLATSTGVHRATVVRAYEELHALGYSDSRSGAYTTVRRRARPPATVHTAPNLRPPPWLSRVDPRAKRVLERGLLSSDPPIPAGGIDFARLQADPDLAPCADLRRCIRSAIARAGSAAFDYAEPAGVRSLREAIAQRLRMHGIATCVDEILITSGAQQALDLALRLLVRPGDHVVVEAPTYGVAHALLRLHGALPIEVPMTPRGLDLQVLERVLARSRPKLVYTMPSFQNPTGLTLDQTQRERLLTLCERARVPIVEDGFEEEMKYFGRPVLPLKSMDARGQVLYVGTFSKVVFPGLRVGWLVAPREAITLLSAMQYAANLAVNTVAQCAAERFCRGGELDAYLRRVHRVYRQRMVALLDGLERYMPEGVEWTRPVGGYALWLTLPAKSGRESLWLQRLGAAGLRLAPGSRFFARAPQRVHFRLSIACVDEARIQTGCRRLGRVLSNGKLRA